MKMHLNQTKPMLNRARLIKSEHDDYVIWSHEMAGKVWMTHH